MARLEAEVARLKDVGNAYKAALSNARHDQENLHDARCLLRELKFCWNSAGELKERLASLEAAGAASAAAPADAAGAEAEARVGFARPKQTSTP